MKYRTSNENDVIKHQAVTTQERMNRLYLAACMHVWVGVCLYRVHVSSMCECVYVAALFVIIPKRLIKIYNALEYTATFIRAHIHTVAET